MQPLMTFSPKDIILSPCLPSSYWSSAPLVQSPSGYWLQFHLQSSIWELSLTTCMLACLGCFSHARLFVTLWTVAHQAPLSMGSPGGSHFFLQGIFPTQGWNPSVLCLLQRQASSLPLERPEEALLIYHFSHFRNHAILPKWIKEEFKLLYPIPFGFGNCKNYFPHSLLFLHPNLPGFLQALSLYLNNVFILGLFLSLYLPLRASANIMFYITWMDVSTALHFSFILHGDQDASMGLSFSFLPRATCLWGILSDNGELMGNWPPGTHRYEQKMETFISHPTRPSVTYWQVWLPDFPFCQAVSCSRVSQVAQWKRICLPMQKMQETWVQSLGWEDPLEKEVATHSIILAWEIPWAEEPGGLQSIGSQKSQTQLSD